MLPLWHRRVSRYIDSIILNGLIKCILNNTKLEKKRRHQLYLFCSWKMLLLIQFHLWYYYNFPPISCSSQSEGAKCKHHGWIRGGGDLVWRWLGGRRAEQDPDGAGGQQPLGTEDCCRWALLELAKRVWLENVLFLGCASSGPCPVAFPNTSHGWLEVSDSVLLGRLMVRAAPVFSAVPQLWGFVLAARPPLRWPCTDVPLPAMLAGWCRDGGCQSKPSTSKALLK